MSHLVELALPFINKNLSLDDISKDTGFIDAYFYDINKPYKDNDFFMLYDVHRENNDETTNCIYKLSNLDNLKDWRVIRINKKPYMLYTFTTNPVIEHLKTGQIPNLKSQLMRLSEFWGIKNPWIFNNVINGGTTYFSPDGCKDEVPEEDYTPEDDILSQLPEQTW